MKIHFLGAAQNVTGSRFLLETGKSKVLIDCGLYQERSHQERNWEDFPVRPSTIDCVLLTHAHIDHCGYLPKLVKEGFKGKIFCTAPTAEITTIALIDSAKLQKMDAEYKKKRHKKEGRKGPYLIEPLYRMEDVEQVFAQFEKVPYQKEVDVTSDIKASYFDSGHILGSAMIECKVAGVNGDKTIIFSGDIGRWETPLLRDPHIFDEADYVVMEATYGGRLHEPREDALAKFERIINETNKRGGNVVIPTFAVERAQELLFYFNQLLKENRIPQLATYLDSPMAINVTEVFKKSIKYFDQETKEFYEKHGKVFEFPLLKMSRSTDDSKAINRAKGTVVILAGSGMCTGGRIKHHLVKNISHAENTILFVGYQANGTLGRQILERPDEVRILGVKRDVKAVIEKVNGFSAHSDQDELLRWLDGFKKFPSKLFIVHSEVDAAAAFRTAVNERFKTDVIIPEYLNEFEL